MLNNKETNNEQNNNKHSNSTGGDISLHVLHFQCHVDKINKYWKNATTWTPENIVNDPESYIDYAESEYDRVLNRLDVLRLTSKLRLSTFQQKESRVNAELLNATQQLQKEKEAIDSSVDTTIHKQSYVSLAKSIKQKKATLSQMAAARLDIQNQITMIESKISDYQNSSDRISANKDKTILNNYISRTKDELDNIETTMDSLGALSEPASNDVDEKSINEEYNKLVGAK